jgi:hypothetical protein
MIIIPSFARLFNEEIKTAKKLFESDENYTTFAAL